MLVSLERNLLLVLTKEAPEVKGYRVLKLSPPFPARNKNPVLLRMPSGHACLIHRADHNRELRDESKMTTNSNFVLQYAWLQPIKRLVEIPPNEKVSIPIIAKAALVDYYACVTRVLPEMEERLRKMEASLEKERELASKALETALELRRLITAESLLSEGGRQLLEAAGDIKLLMLHVEELKLAVNEGFKRVLEELREAREELRKARERLREGDKSGVEEALDRAEQRLLEAGRVAKELPAWAADNPWLRIIAGRSIHKGEGEA